MKPVAISIVAAVILVCVTPAQSAVLITTGTTSDGKAFVTLPTVQFAVNFWSSGINGISLDIVNAWPTPGMVTVASGSGLSFSSLQNSTVVPLIQWSDHAVLGTSLTERDSALRTSSSTSYLYAVGDTITLQGGTFALATANPSFAIFQSGSYTIYLVGTNNGFSVGPITTAGVAVPEPSTSALVGLFVLGIIALRRRN